MNGPEKVTQPVDHEMPTLEELTDARVRLRKQFKSGNPARKASALQQIRVLELLIRDQRALEAKAEVPA